MPPMGPQLEWQKNILTLLALPKDFDLLPSGLQTCHAFAAYVMVLIPRAYVVLYEKQNGSQWGQIYFCGPIKRC